ncbi:MAG TPA: 5-formyltetrahydrofolate cyclo-ligase [Firmicutes bacterium]|nr:5-formyltetrahydrofolate cyclo-ligase [Bacillota bacterium]
MDKNEIRTMYKRARREVTEREEKEKLIADKLIAKLGSAKTVFCYESIGGEVSTKEIIARISGFARVYVPEVCGKEMFAVAEGSGGKEYADGPCDVTVVPLIAFDKTLNRIGFGGGYYDRYLGANDTIAIGIAFDEQECGVFEKEDTDIPLDMIVTPTRILEK